MNCHAYVNCLSLVAIFSILTLWYGHYLSKSLTVTETQSETVEGALLVCDFNKKELNLATHFKFGLCHFGYLIWKSQLNKSSTSRLGHEVIVVVPSNEDYRNETLSPTRRSTPSSNLSKLSNSDEITLFGFVRFGDFVRLASGKYLGICIRLHKPLLWEYKRKRYLKRKLIYSSNSIATFNPPIFSLILLRSGDIETQPGRVNHTSTDSESSTAKGYRKIKVGHLNVRSLKNQTHFSPVKETVFLHKFDIFTISESWLDKSVSNAELDILGYSLYRQDRLQAKGGGVCAFVRNSIQVLPLSNISSICERLQQFWLQVQLNKCKSLVLCVAYRPPNSPASLLS